MFPTPIGNEALQLAYCHRFELDSEHARALALRFLRAHTATYRRQGRILRDDSGRACKVAFDYPGDKIRNLHIHRTGRHTARFFAVQATRCLQHRLFGIIAIAHLFKVCSPPLRVLFPDRDSWYSVCHLNYILFVFLVYIPFLIGHVPPVHFLFQKKSILKNSSQTFPNYF